jgi:hypothetical protein
VNIHFATCTEEELWRFVATHLERNGIGVVLVGGAVVSVHSRGAYRSGDLDFVPEALFSKTPDDAMAEIGFHRTGRHSVHPDCHHLFVEFVAGPLGIGEDHHIVPQEMDEGDVSIKLLSPTDCVRDRLASYIHFGARECLDQAALVARAHSLDWEKVERWCQEEGSGGPVAYADLRRIVNPSDKPS